VAQFIGVAGVLKVLSEALALAAKLAGRPIETLVLFSQQSGGTALTNSIMQRHCCGSKHSKPQRIIQRETDQC